MIQFSNLEELHEYLEEFSPETKTADGLDEALMGLAQNAHGTVAVYDREKCIEIFQRDMESYEEAEEWFEYNTIRSLAYAGELAPIFMTGLLYA